LAEWVVAQRDSMVKGKPGITEEEYETRPRFAAVGIRSEK
jgi:hypothetical protein